MEQLADSAGNGCLASACMLFGEYRRCHQLACRLHRQVCCILTAWGTRMFADYAQHTAYLGTPQTGS
jgi:hypothetical protein